MDKEAGDACNRVVLQETKMVCVSLGQPFHTERIPVNHRLLAFPKIMQNNGNFQIPKRGNDWGEERRTSTEMPPIPPTLARSPALNCSGTSRRNTVSMCSACSCSPAGRSCRLNHRQGAW
jgi:hypothetical protein